MNLPERKRIRLKNFDYSSPGLYFITLCIKGRKAILSKIVYKENIERPKEIILTKYGEIVDKAIKNISSIYPSISIDNYVIIPDHIHILLRIHTSANGMTPIGLPKVNRVVQQTKGYITKQLGFSIWQRSFNDHIVRGDNDYKEIWEYIENNPLK